MIFNRFWGFQLQNPTKTSLRTISSGITIQKKLNDRREYMKYVVLLHFMYDVPADVFDLPNGSEFRDLVYQKQKNDIKVYEMGDFNDTMEMRNTISRGYSNAANLMLEKLNHDFLVYDYLERYNAHRYGMGLIMRYIEK